MASERTGFRESLQTSLANILKIRFVPGPLTGPQLENTYGCVWWEGKRPFARDGNEEENYYRVRVIPQFKAQEGPTPLPFTSPINADIEELAETLEAALRAVLTSAGHDFFNVVEVTADYTAQFVEAQLVAYDRNRSARGG